MTHAPKSNHRMVWFRVEVSDQDGQIVAIEPEMLAGRDIGDAEREVICKAIDNLIGFLGLPHRDADALRVEQLERELAEERSELAYLRDHDLENAERAFEDCQSKLTAAYGECATKTQALLKIEAALADARRKALDVCLKVETDALRADQPKIAWGATKCIDAIRAALAEPHASKETT